MNPLPPPQTVLKHFGIATTIGVVVTLALRLIGIRWTISLPLLEAR